MLKAAGQEAPSFHPILEVNPEHALVKGLHADSANFDDWCHLLFDQALLAEGGALEDPASFVKRTNALLRQRIFLPVAAAPIRPPVPTCQAKTLGGISSGSGTRFLQATYLREHTA